MKKIRIGLVGAGSISNEHTRAYKQMDNVELVAVCDIKPGRAEEYAKKYGFERWYLDYNEMFEKEELDAISVCTWNCAHAEVTIAALNAKINVLCEKPMAMNAEEAEAMKEAADKNGKLLMIGFVRRFMPSTNMLKEYIDNGEFGDIYYITTGVLRRVGNPLGWFADKEKSGGGPLIDLGVHMIDLSRYLMGKPSPVAVSCMTYSGIGSRTNIKGINRYTAADPSPNCNVEDMAVAMIRFDNGATVHAELSFSSHLKENKFWLDVFGSKSGATIEPKLEIYSEKNDYLTDVKPIYDEDTDNGFSPIFKNEIEHFVGCVANGTECINTADDGIMLMKILDAAYKSAELGREVEI